MLSLRRDSRASSDAAPYQVRLAYNGMQGPGSRAARRRARSQPARREGRAAISLVRRSTTPRRAADRRAERLGRRCGLPRREHQGRHDRHRHRLHARRLRRPGHGGRLRGGERGRRRDAAEPGAGSGPTRPRSRAASTSSATPTTPTGRRDDYQLIPHPDPNPLDCNGPRHARRRHRRRHRRHGRRQRPTPGRTTRPPSRSHRWTIGPGVAPQGRAVRASASSAAPARPTSPSTPSSGRSRTTWT